MADDEENDPTAPFNELETFDSLWEALTWKQIKKRVPICAQKTRYNRYFLANLVYLIYAIGILLIDFYPRSYSDAEAGNENCTDYAYECPYENYTDYAYECPYENYTGYAYECPYENCTEPAREFSLENRLYISLGVIHLISATLYWWAWRDHRWNDVIMIPEYLNHIEAALYLWSAIWYVREEECGLYVYGYYTTRIHIIETVAAFVELFASFGWIMSWYRTYTRAICRGFTFDDPDTIAYTLTTLSSFIYITYNIQILQYPHMYGSNYIYTNGDIIYFVGAFFYLWANLRDDGWLWWLPVGGQYGLAAGRIQTGKPVKVGLPHLLIGGGDPCASCCRPSFKNNLVIVNNDVVPLDEKQNATNNNTKDAVNRA
ncbi:unnamed protein product [Rotaria magnacalcarata]|uniref:Uncharacterized protein n=1 Tax=Rotaria magnacalcarata TaxID=392030 RepID=A0A816LB20_9BILA|nr:unnamed protein product [Rotaria magnacalcarata]CAF3801168.1 unnamed protein product [Rotaria magnacalcarata]